MKCLEKADLWASLPLFLFFYGCCHLKPNNYHIKAVICSLMHFSNGFLAVVANLAACFFFFFYKYIFLNYEQIIQPLPLDYCFGQFHISCGKMLEPSLNFFLALHCFNGRIVHLFFSLPYNWRSAGCGVSKSSNRCFAQCIYKVRLQL